MDKCPTPTRSSLFPPRHGPQSLRSEHTLTRRVIEAIPLDKGDWLTANSILRRLRSRNRSRTRRNSVPGMVKCLPANPARWRNSPASSSRKFSIFAACSSFRRLSTCSSFSVIRSTTEASSRCTSDRQEQKCLQFTAKVTTARKIRKPECPLSLKMDWLSRRPVPR